LAMLMAATAACTRTAADLDAQDGPAPAAAQTLRPPSSPSLAPDADGFIQRWLILEPIRRPGPLADSAVRAAVNTQYFPDQFTVLPRDGDRVTVNDTALVWH